MNEEEEATFGACVKLVYKTYGNAKREIAMATKVPTENQLAIWIYKSVMSKRIMDMPVLDKEQSDMEEFVKSLSDASILTLQRCQDASSQARFMFWMNQFRTQTKGTNTRVHLKYGDNQTLSKEVKSAFISLMDSARQSGAQSIHPGFEGLKNPSNTKPVPTQKGGKRKFHDNDADPHNAGEDPDASFDDSVSGSQTLQSSYPASKVKRRGHSIFGALPVHPYGLGQQQQQQQHVFDGSGPVASQYALSPQSANNARAYPPGQGGPPLDFKFPPLGDDTVQSENPNAAFYGSMPSVSPLSQQELAFHHLTNRYAYPTEGTQYRGDFGNGETAYLPHGSAMTWPTPYTGPVGIPSSVNRATSSQLSMHQPPLYPNQILVDPNQYGTPPKRSIHMIQLQVSHNDDSRAQACASLRRLTDMQQ